MAVFSVVALAMVALIAMGPGRAGVGVAHYAAGAVIALAGAVVAMMKGKR